MFMPYEPATFAKGRGEHGYPALIVSSVLIAINDRSEQLVLGHFASSQIYFEIKLYQNTKPEARKYRSFV